MEKTIQVVSIAGFDSGGGAGLQADTKTFQERGVYGTNVLTALPIQNTQGVRKVYDLPLSAIEEQLQVIQDDFTISAVKTGMLFSTEIVKLVADFLKKVEFGPLIVDPVMIAKSGHSLLKETAVEAVVQDLIPIATVITPNIPEAEVISQQKISSAQDMIAAAQKIQKLGVKHIILKGGHSKNFEISSDLLLTEAGQLEWLSSSRIQTKNTHGTGCTFSACLTAELGKGRSIEEASRIAKAFIQAAISDGIQVGKGNGPTNHWAYRKVENHG